MPTVPQDRNRVAIEGLPSARSNVNYSPEALGADIGRGVQRLGGALGEIAQQEQQKQDTAALMSAERQLQEWQNNALFAPETGAYAQRGQNAFGLPEKLLPEWDKRVGDVEAGLTERQRQVFRQRAGNMRVSMQRDLQRHIGAEAEAFHKQETAALVTTRLDTAMLYWQDPARFDAELREAQSVFMAGNPGIPPAAMQVGLREIESRARAGVIGRMIDTDAIGAQRYYDTYRDTMNEADRAQVERVLNPARDAAEAEREVARARGRAVPGQAPPSDFATYRRRLESGGRADAKNPDSSATGADQFIESTWMEMVNKTKPAWAEGLTRAQVLALRTDPEKSAEMANALAQENAARLQAAGVPVTNETLYAAHHFGAGGGVAFGKASLDTPMSDILSAEQLDANPYLKGKTKAEAIANWNRRAGATAGEGPAAPMEKADALAYLSGIDNPKVRQLALSRYQTELQIEQVRKQEETEAFYESINTKIEASNPATPVRDVLSKEEYALAVEQGKLPAIEERQANRLKGTALETPPDQLMAYRDVVYKAAGAGTPEQVRVARAELAKYNPYDPHLPMSMADRDWLAQSKAAVLSGDKKKTAAVATEGEFNSVIRQYTVGTLGIGKDKSGEEQNKAIAGSTEAQEFDRAMRMWADQYQAENGKAPSYTDVRKQADAITLGKLSWQETVPGMIWDSTKDMTIAELGIPQEKYDDIVNVLYANNLPITPANIKFAIKKYPELAQ